MKIEAQFARFNTLLIKITTSQVQQIYWDGEIRVFVEKCTISIWCMRDKNMNKKYLHEKCKNFWVWNCNPNKDLVNRSTVNYYFTNVKLISK